MNPKLSRRETLNKALCELLFAINREGGGRPKLSRRETLNKAFCELLFAINREGGGCVWTGVDVHTVKLGHIVAANIKSARLTSATTNAKPTILAMISKFLGNAGSRL